MNPACSKVSVAKNLCAPLNPKAGENTHYVCTVKNCKSTLSAVKPSNLVVHMERQHGEIFQKHYAKAMLHSRGDRKLSIRRLRFIQHLAELVTINNRPLACLYDSGLKKLIGREIDFLTNAGHGAGLTAGQSKCPPAILEYIDTLSMDILQEIKTRVAGRLISLMVDIGSRNGRDILGIAIQYVTNGRAYIHSIGMVLLSKAQTSENIRIQISACLEMFGIQPNQVVSITTDNGSNMLAMVKLFNKDQEQSSGSDNNETSNDNDTNLDENENENLYEIPDEEIDRIIHEYNAVNANMTDAIENEARNAEAREILNETERYLEILKELHNDFALHTLSAHGIKCAAHTLQLATKDALKVSSARALINVCRAACKLLRKKKYKNRMSTQNFKVVLPKLDCIVRWNSTFVMVSRINYCAIPSTFLPVCRSIVHGIHKMRQMHDE